MANTKDNVYEIEIPEGTPLYYVFGPQDSVITRIQSAYPQVLIDYDDDSTFFVYYDDKTPIELLEEIEFVFWEVFNLANKGVCASFVDLKNARKEAHQPQESFKRSVIMKHQGKAIVPKTAGQARYAKAIEESTITICRALAGTGKTFIAVAEAVNMLKKNQVERIVITRPAVPAFGEDLGALPGDVDEKMNPYLRPITDAMSKLVSPPKLEDWFAKGIVEICPLAFMRGRTFDNAFVLADEMQNSFPEQVEMLLSRLGENTKCVVEGDPYQQDRAYVVNNGLNDSIKVLKHTPGVSVVEMTEEDCVRSEIASEVVKAYRSQKK